MSFHNDSNIYCGPGNEIDYRRVYKLAELHFCPNCQSPKSKLQCIYKIESKFCPNCLQNFSSKVSTCGRNCFSCLKCSGHILVSVTDHSNGKSFEFNCTYCQYSYVTKIISKPKALSSILKQERLERDLFANTFNKFKSDLQSDDLNLSDTVKKNLQLSGIIEKSDKKIKLSLSNDTIPSIFYPQSRKLSTKCSVRCLDCKTYLLVPKDDTPTINKFDINFMALDYLPLIKVMNKNILSFINPLNSSILVKLKWNNPLVHLPITEFTLKPSSALGSHALIKKLPTSYLTDKSTISRSELILRKDTNIQTGNNWIQFPIEFEEPVKKLPIYITLKGDLPENWTKSLKPDLNFGYWNIIEFNKEPGI